MVGKDGICGMRMLLVRHYVDGVPAILLRGQLVFSCPSIGESLLVLSYLLLDNLP